MANKPMTEEAKKAAAQKRARTIAAKKAAEEQKSAMHADSIAVSAQEAANADNSTVDDKLRDEEIETLREKNKRLEEQTSAMMQQMRELQEQMQRMGQPRVVTVSSESERIHFLWQAEVADDNVQMFGDNGMYGRIVGKTGSFYVPKSDISRLLDERTRYFLKRRWLIVVSGLDEQEREMLGVDYKKGEILDRNAFAKMIDLGDEILQIYPSLCEGHKEMVAKRYYESWMKGNRNITRERVVQLNRMSKREGHENGDFLRIIEEMNDADTK